LLSEKTANWQSRPPAVDRDEQLSGIPLDRVCAADDRRLLNSAKAQDNSSK